MRSLNKHKLTHAADYEHKAKTYKTGSDRQPRKDKGQEKPKPMACVLANLMPASPEETRRLLANETVPMDGEGIRMEIENDEELLEGFQESDHEDGHAGAFLCLQGNSNLERQAKGKANLVKTFVEACKPAVNSETE